MTDFLRDVTPSYADSPVESRRFGLSVARLVVPMRADPVTALPWLRDTLADAPHDLVVLRYPAQHVTWAAALLDPGRDMVHADALVHFTRRLEGEPTIPPLDLTPLEGTWRAARDRDVDPDAMDGLVDAAFADFSNHYAANPLLDPAAALAGYREWVRATIEQDRVLCVSDEHGPAAFIAWAVDGPICELKIGGVHPRAQGRRLFGRVLLEAFADGQRAGCAEGDSPTQVHNLRQMAVSWRIGLRIGGVCNTVHVLRDGLLNSRRR